MKISKVTLFILAAWSILFTQAVFALKFAPERGYAVESEEIPPPVAKPTNTDIRMPRDYPTQAPTVPHTITAYVIDKNGNKCLSCHKRTRISDSQAPMVSVTHYIDRDNEILADVSPRRYFCTQCHVPRTDAPPLINNTFIDVEKLIATPTKAKITDHLKH